MCSPEFLISITNPDLDKNFFSTSSNLNKCGS
nr:MAG TPA: hypothetical protein [Bacteriophage sp.]